MEEVRFVVLMGVAGAGKTTVGRLLTATLAWRFIDGDEYHLPAAIEKMKQGIGLTEEDRKPWLTLVAKAIEECVLLREKAVVACSALKRAHRQQLLAAGPGGVIVHLKGDEKLIKGRLVGRSGHFFDPGLLTGQFAALEEPAGEERVTVDISQSPSEIVAFLRAQFRGRITRPAEG